jgi:hypothetical protein
LNEGRKKGELEPLKAEELKKVHFMLLSKAEQIEHAPKLKTLRRRDSLSGSDELVYDAYWSIETLAGLHIGFVGLIDKRNADSTRNLNLRLSLEKAKDFGELWRNLNAARQR